MRAIWTHRALAALAAGAVVMAGAGLGEAAEDAPRLEPAGEAAGRGRGAPPPPPPEPVAPVPPEPVAPEPPGAEPSIAPRVSIGRLDVGGMSAVAAAAAVEAAFARPLVFRHGARRFPVAPAELGARADVTGAVSRALRAAPGAEVVLPVSVDRDAVRAFVARLARAIERAPRDARLRVVAGTPSLRQGRPGLAVRTARTAALAVRKLRLDLRTPVRVRTTRVAPGLRGPASGRVVVVERSSRRLRLYEGRRLVRTFRIAVGLPEHPTPLGAFRVVTKQRNPWWYPPASDWAEGLRPVPPGPGNPLGTRWMGLSASLIGIHGTPDAASIGYSASHGCIRMRVRAAEWLFERIRVGTPVYVVRR